MGTETEANYEEALQAVRESIVDQIASEEVISERMVSSDLLEVILNIQAEEETAVATEEVAAAERAAYEALSFTRRFIRRVARAVGLAVEGAGASAASYVIGVLAIFAVVGINLLIKGDCTLTGQNCGNCRATHTAVSSFDPFLKYGGPIMQYKTNDCNYGQLCQYSNAPFNPGHSTALSYGNTPKTTAVGLECTTTFQVFNQFGAAVDCAVIIFEDNPFVGTNKHTIRKEGNECRDALTDTDLTVEVGRPSENHDVAEVQYYVYYAAEGTFPPHDLNIPDYDDSDSPVVADYGQSIEDGEDRELFGDEVEGAAAVDTATATAGSSRPLAETIFVGLFALTMGLF